MQIPRRKGRPKTLNPMLIEQSGLPLIVGESARMRKVYALMQKVAPTDANVCIQGENGTGKELIARALHFSGPRRERPYVTLDCSTIAEGLIESHLFGHVRGAFTGAVATRPGVFAQAHTGTLFIDEITELAPHLQAKLLRVIQTGEFTMVGGSQPQRADVRIITASNKNLHEAISKGIFREDLYHRIAVVLIELPPMRERSEDIPLLVAHFLRRFIAKGYGKQIRGLTSRAMEALMAYPWPGNVRQLENWLEQALVLLDENLDGGLIDLKHFPSLQLDSSGEWREALPLGLKLHELERRYILATLKRVGDNRTKAAKVLGISLRGLQYKLRRYAALDEQLKDHLKAVGDVESAGPQEEAETYRQGGAEAAH